MNTELADLLQTHTPEPPPEIDLEAMAARARSTTTPRRGRPWLLPATAAAAVAAVTVAAVGVSRLAADPPFTADPTTQPSPSPSPAGRGAPTAAELSWATRMVETWRPGGLHGAGGTSAVGIMVERVDVAADGRTLTARFAGVPGPASRVCGEDYYGYPIESGSVVGILVTRVSYPQDGRTQTICSLRMVTRTVTLRLARPLSTRVVIETVRGFPVQVVHR